MEVGNGVDALLRKLQGEVLCPLEVASGDEIQWRLGSQLGRALRGALRGPWSALLFDR